MFPYTHPRKIFKPKEHYCNLKIQNFKSRKVLLYYNDNLKIPKRCADFSYKIK